ncbi:MAG: hypothetical protein IT385_25390 [Deltaproteobacteria bacterium]|nr:hypothetical protein [Deltaproteobacteria bacterium]
MRVTLASSLIATLTLACADGAKPDVTEDFSDLAVMNQKADYFSSKLKLLGTLEDGDTARVRYTKTPRFRGYDFVAAPGDEVDVWVRSSRGDALAWIVDGNFDVIAKNDDADDTTYDAHIIATLPESGADDGRYYLIFRDYNVETRYFDIELHLAGALPAGMSAAAVIAALQPSLGTESPRARGEIEVFNESGDHGVNTFADALPGAKDIDDAVAMAKDRWARWGFSHWEMEVDDQGSADAIEGFLAAARGLYAEEDLEPAEVDPIIDAFAERVQRTFGSLSDVRLVTGATVDFERGGVYLFGKTTDGWVALAVRQYRDG